MDYRKGCLETRINVQVAVGGSESLLGRIRFFDESYTEGAILCVRGEEHIDRQLLLLCPPIAVIAFCQGSTDSLGELCSLGVPCLVLSESDLGYEIFKNRVALIDTEHGILTLDPSLDTLGAYSASKRKWTIASLDCPMGKIIKNLNVEKNAAENFEYYFSSASILRSDDVFESAVGLWERLCPELLIFDVAVPKGAENEARVFSERIEELYRSALYGSLAISLSGFDCESELTDALRLLHKAFCILEAEGREFNSYLPRGITLSAPLWLTRPSPVTNPDFLVFDLDTLLPSLFSLAPDEIIKKEKALKKELLSAFERYFLNFAPYCEMFIKTECFLNAAFMRDLVRLANVKAVFGG